MVLGPRTGNDGHGLVEVNLGPFKAANLDAAAGREEQELHDLAVAGIRQGSTLPDDG
jgi:hypothetical protein